MADRDPIRRFIKSIDSNLLATILSHADDDGVAMTIPAKLIPISVNLAISLTKAGTLLRRGGRIDLGDGGGVGKRGRICQKSLFLVVLSRIVSEQDGRESCNILHAAGPSKVVITSINIDGNLLLIGSNQKENGQTPVQFKIVIRKIPAYFTGTGDLTTALLLGWSNKYPDNLEKAVELAVSSLQVQTVLVKMVSDYERAGYDPKSSSLEIRLIQSQDYIRNPEVKYKAEMY